MPPDQAEVQDDARWVAAVLAGDASCYRFLFDRYWNSMVGLALSRLRDRQRAEEAVQDSFVQAYLRLKDLRDPARFGGWLARIVINQCKAELRRRGRERTVPLEELTEGQTPTVEPVSTNPGLDPAQRRQVREAVARLPMHFRQALLLRCVGGLSAVAVGRQLGRRPETVRVWLHRALKLLRRDLEPLRKELTP